MLAITEISMNTFRQVKEEQVRIRIFPEHSYTTLV